MQLGVNKALFFAPVYYLFCFFYEKIPKCNFPGFRLVVELVKTHRMYLIHRMLEFYTKVDSCQFNYSLDIYRLRYIFYRVI